MFAQDNVTLWERHLLGEFVIVVEFRDGKIAAERIYWDRATVLRQIGLLQ